MARLGLVKDHTNTGVFRIIDDWTKHFVAELTYDEAVAKYGECGVESAYTDGFTGDPKRQWKAIVWVNIPGMKLTGRNNNRINIVGGNNDHAEFIGKKRGMKIVVDRLGDNDYSAWWTDEGYEEDPTYGYSVRGSMCDIVDEIEEEL